MWGVCPHGYALMRDIPAGVSQFWKDGARPKWIMENWPPAATGTAPPSERVRSFLEVMLGRRLASGTLRAAGIDQLNGDVFWVPAETWRVIPNYDRPDQTNLALALVGHFIRTVGGDYNGRPCLPLLVINDFRAFMDMPELPIPLSVEPLESRRRVVAPSSPPTETKSPENGPTVHAGGRLPRHDWDAFWIEICWYAAENDLEREHRPELQRHMEKWVAERWDHPPEDTTIRKKLQALFARRTAPN